MGAASTKAGKLRQREKYWQLKETIFSQTKTEQHIVRLYYPLSLYLHGLFSAMAAPVTQLSFHRLHGLLGMRWYEIGENYIMRSFVV
jgi:hypothetical protein